MNDIYKKNFEALEKTYPQWKKYIEDKEYEQNKEYLEQELLEFIIEESYSSEIITKVCSKNGKYYLSGKYAPENNGNRIIEKVKLADYGNVIYLIGFSDGRVLRKILKNISDDVILIVYEPSLSLFLNIMETYDISDVLENDNFVLIVEGINGKELDVVVGRTITIENITKIIPIIQGNYDRLFPSYVKKAIGVISERVKGLRFHWNTMVEFTNETIVNNIKNFKYLYNHYSINSLYNFLPKDVPVIVVAAGPSLDINIDDLKKAKGKACIIACDTALKPLLNRNITPDFFVVVDPRKPMELFEHHMIKDIPMITGLNVPHDLMKKHIGKKIIYFDTPYIHSLLNYVFADEVYKDINRMNSVPTGGSVATSAFSIGRLFGTRTIILIGQDLALSAEKEHASGTFKNDREYKNQRENLPKVEGINGEMIPTLYNLKSYLEWFEKEIVNYKESLKVIDATEGGALIHGSEVMTLKEAIDKYCFKQIDINEILDNTPKHFDDEQRVKALEFFESIPKELEMIEKKVKEGIKYYTKLEKLASEKNYQKDKIRNVMKKIKKCNTYLDNDDLADLIMEGLKGVEYTLRTNVYQFYDDEQKNLVESAKMGKIFLRSMDIAINEIKPLIMELSEYKGAS